MAITLTDGGFSAVIDPHGAQLVSLKGNGTEYLWQGDEAYWGGQAPVLFPFVGGLRSGRTIMKNRIIECARHGFARRSQFSVDDQTVNSVTLSIRDNDETRKIYPYSFMFKMKYTLSGGTLTQEFITENTGDEVLPFAVGGHPAFNIPMEEGLSFEDYRVQFAENETQDAPTVNLQTGLIDFINRYPLLKNEAVISLKHELFDADALVFDSLKKSSVSLLSGKGERGIRVDFDGFPYLGIWSAVGTAPFVAIEPWTGCATCEDEDDEFTHKRNLTMLAPKGISSSAFTITML